MGKALFIRASSKVFRRFGYAIKPLEGDLFDSLSKEDIEIINKVKPFTMTTPVRVVALLEAVRYVIKNGITGSIVECGVWQGGSIMATAIKLKKMNSIDKDLFLFDTFEGMPKPTNVDIDYTGVPAHEEFERLKINNHSSNWARVPLEEVKKAVYSTGYPKEKIHFVKGKVENTLPANAPNSISILRLDTDFYESTIHELFHLFPRLSPGGVLIIDDYGYFKGAQKAVDEYFKKNKIPLLLNRIDFSGRIAIKL